MPQLNIQKTSKFLYIIFVYDHSVHPFKKDKGFAHVFAIVDSSQFINKARTREATTIKKSCGKQIRISSKWGL